MRKLFFALVLCAFLGVNGSKSTKKTGRLMRCFKTGMIVLIGNEIANDRYSQVNTGDIECRYNLQNLPEQEVMLKFAVCAKDEDFEKYLVDNSDNCSIFKKVYEKVKEYAKCTSTTSKSIIKGVLTKFSGEQLPQEKNMEMLQEYLLSLGEFEFRFYSKSRVSEYLQDLEVSHRENFNFFRFKRIYDLLDRNTTNPWVRSKVSDALDKKFDDIDLDHVDTLLELATQLYFERLGHSDALKVALDSKWKDVNVDKVKQVLEYLLTSSPKYMKELIEMDYKEDNKGITLWKNEKEHVKFYQQDALMEALKIAKDVDVEHAKRLFKLLSHCAYGSNWNETTALKLKEQKVDNRLRDSGYLGDMVKWYGALTSLESIDRAALEALQTKYRTVNVKKVYEKYDELNSSWTSWWHYKDEKAMINDAFKVTHPDIIKEEF